VGVPQSLTLDLVARRYAFFAVAQSLPTSPTRRELLHPVLQQEVQHGPFMLHLMLRGKRLILIDL
jgi:hypothetical protein